ncbi:uncharacterized protein LOC124307657 [Neodiprion virginianus]|uniref:uncharacterized protein LOC124307657 n=1 Tax=Neodiprion virginianus TaxID=2961670 RepID=UPI001EE773EA|nr:uncharacterized protein LOC124307657 [Neodiprion virginianus]
MSINTLFYGLVLMSMDEVLVRASGMSGLGEDGGSLHPYNTGEQEIEPFDYTPAKRDDNGQEKPKIPGSVYVRFGRNHAEKIPAEAERETRGRSDGFIRFGRSHPKASQHRNEPGFGGLERIQRGNKWFRMGRNAPSDNENNIASKYAMLKAKSDECDWWLKRCHANLVSLCTPDDDDTDICREQDGRIFCDSRK